MKNRKLLFFFSDETCSSCAAIVPTLSRLADELGIDFETYICARPMSWQGKVLPTVGHGHLESFYYLANFYDEIFYCSISSFGSFPFRREVLAFGGSVISARREDECAEFYGDIYSFFGRPLPAEIMILPDRYEGKAYLAPYCYPDIAHRNCLGVSEHGWEKQKEAFRALGIQRACALYCAPGDAEVLDSVREGDTYGSMTERIAQRNLAGGRQIGFVDADSLLRWQTYYIRQNVLALYQDYDWEAFIPTVKRYSDAVGSKNIIGTQVVYNPKQNMVRNNDNVIAELGRYGLIHNLIGVNPRIGFTVQTQHPLPLDWMEDEQVPTPWDEEYTDAYLIERLEKHDIPVCFLFYAADLGHLPVLTHFLNMMCLDGMRGGIAFPSTWYAYQPELLEQLYIPLQQGGVCPNLEPLISSVGVAVATEAEGYIAPEFLGELLTQARNDIAKAVGKSRVPRGYYPFQDATPFYKAGGRPQYDVVSRLGFDYYVTYQNSEKPAAIQYEKNGMIVLNQQTPQWFPGYGNPLERLKEWEKSCHEQNEAYAAGKSGQGARWITFGFDTPFFALTPNYLGEIEFDSMRLGWAKSAGMHEIYRAIQYVRRSGGESGKLFLVKPHELARFARLAEERGLLAGAPEKE